MEVYDCGSVGCGSVGCGSVGCGSVGCGIVGVWDWGRVYLDVLLRFIILPLVLRTPTFLSRD